LLPPSPVRASASLRGGKKEKGRKSGPVILRPFDQSERGKKSRGPKKEARLVYLSLIRQIDLDQKRRFKVAVFSSRSREKSPDGRKRWSIVLLSALESEGRESRGRSDRFVIRKRKLRIRGGKKEGKAMSRPWSSDCDKTRRHGWTRPTGRKEERAPQKKK